MPRQRGHLLTQSIPDAQCRTAATSPTSEEVAGLKTNDDGTFMLDEKNYPLKAFVPEAIYLGGIYKVFWDTRRDKYGAITQAG